VVGRRLISACGRRRRRMPQGRICSPWNLEIISNIHTFLLMGKYEVSLNFIHFIIKWPAAWGSVTNSGPW
jgi:hypothetical protein